MSAGGTLPDTPKFREVSIKSVNPSIVTLSSSGRRQVKTQNAQFWAFTATYPPLKRAEWAPIAAFIQQQRGSRFAFNVKIPEYSDTLGAVTTETLLVNGAHTAGDTSITLSSGSINTTGALKAGDFVSFAVGGVADHNKVYMVTSDVDFSSGAATMNIEPGLQIAMSGGENVVYNNVTWKVFLTEQDQTWNMGLASTVGYELSFREAL